MSKVLIRIKPNAPRQVHAMNIAGNTITFEKARNFYAFDEEVHGAIISRCREELLDEDNPTSGLVFDVLDEGTAKILEARVAAKEAGTLSQPVQPEIAGVKAVPAPPPVQPAPVAVQPAPVETPAPVALRPGQKRPGQKPEPPAEITPQGE